MDKVIIEVPEGSYCSDETHLDCIYAVHSDGFHRCSLFCEPLNGLEEFYVKDERRRAHRKCNKCLATVNEYYDGLYRLISSEDLVADLKKEYPPGYTSHLGKYSRRDVSTTCDSLLNAQKKVFEQEQSERVVASRGNQRGLSGYTESLDKIISSNPIDILSSLIEESLIDMDCTLNNFNYSQGSPTRVLAEKLIDNFIDMLNSGR